ncbi:hypothetical protein [Fusobacterium perfoetens]|uniref:hypothetical protein n=1 Tax=Fusobacterium perfoetens TaxID=852 RepID=UPI000484C2AC|nr:hypothetical protein [Fusobacterium perfoetens]
MELKNCLVKASFMTSSRSKICSEGIIFKNENELGIILPLIDIDFDREYFTCVEIEGINYPREFEFSLRKDIVILKNENLMYVPLDEIYFYNCIIHKEKVYTKKELANIVYCTENDFTKNPNELLKLKQNREVIVDYRSIVDILEDM